MTDRPGGRPVRERTREPTRDRGAILVETAIVLPMLLVLISGVIEIGLLVGDHQAAVSASRSGARMISSAGNDRLADHMALQAMAGPLSDYAAADIIRLTVYRAETDGSMPSGCEVAPVPGRCNHYFHADLFRPAGDFSGTTSCGSSAPDVDWCPTSRENRLASSPDWVGVRVELRHRSSVPFVTDQIVTDTTIMRIEPRPDP